jgi:hypothetical protein
MFLLNSMDPCKGLVVVALQLTELLFESLCFIALCLYFFSQELIEPSLL